MEFLAEMLASVKECTGCGLREDNALRGIPFVPVRPKPNARVMFIGRDPNPKTAAGAGAGTKQSAFTKGVFDLAGKAGLDEDFVYITDLVKCHWRASSGTPLPGTERRAAKLDTSIANTCMTKWLTKELEMLQPRLIVGFGEELYQALRPFIVYPFQVPETLAAGADKSVPDAESWFVAHGPLTVKIGNVEWPLAVLRNPGNTKRLPQGDPRLLAYNKAARRTVEFLQKAKTKVI